MTSKKERGYILNKINLSGTAANKQKETERRKISLPDNCHNGLQIHLISRLKSIERRENNCRGSSQSVITTVHFGLELSAFCIGAFHLNHQILPLFIFTKRPFISSYTVNTILVQLHLAHVHTELAKSSNN